MCGFVGGEVCRTWIYISTFTFISITVSRWDLLHVLQWVSWAFLHKQPTLLIAIRDEPRSQTSESDHNFVVGCWIGKCGSLPSPPSTLSPLHPLSPMNYSDFVTGHGTSPGHHLVVDFDDSPPRVHWKPLEICMQFIYTQENMLFTVFIYN